MHHFSDFLHFVSIDKTFAICLNSDYSVNCFCKVNVFYCFQLVALQFFLLTDDFI